MSKLETNTIDTVSGTSTLQIGSTNTGTITLGASGDTVTLPSNLTEVNLSHNNLINTDSRIGSGSYLSIGATYTNSGLSLKSNTTSTHSLLEFHNTNGQVGTITTSSSATASNTSSDYRLKENVVEMEDATTRLKKLQPKRFNFIADPNKTVDGFLAHEVSDIVPEAISGEKDETDKDNNPKYQGIDQSKLVPLLVKTIQELEARITELENK